MSSLSSRLLIASTICMVAGCANLAESALARENFEVMAEVSDIDKLISQSASRSEAALNFLLQYADSVCADPTREAEEKEKTLATVQERITEMRLVEAFEAEEFARLRKLKRPSDRLFLARDRTEPGKRYVLVRGRHIVAKSSLFPLNIGEGP